MDSNHLRIAERPAQGVAARRLDVAEVEHHSFVSSKAALEIREDDCSLVVGSFVPSGEHTLVLVAHVPVLALFPSPSPTCLVHVPVIPSPFASIFLCPSPALSPFPASPCHSHTNCASLHTQAYRMPSPFGVQAEQQDPPVSQTDSRCASGVENFRPLVEAGHCNR